MKIVNAIKKAQAVGARVFAKDEMGAAVSTNVNVNGLNLVVLNDEKLTVSHR